MTQAHARSDLCTLQSTNSISEWGRGKDGVNTGIYSISEQDIEDNKCHKIILGSREIANTADRHENQHKNDIQALFYSCFWL